MRDMSYLVLARKYRPRAFGEMVGQDHVVKALTHALEQQRLHHAYLFTGTRGVGKTTVSRILAKSLNCQGADGQGGITAQPCGVCPACLDIDAGRFVDYTELDAASNRGVDEVQALLEQAVYKPVSGRFKVFMIDEVHMLTNTAFNAMLKTLEEPPEYLKFVLATTDPQKVPVTVLSRCLQFNLRPMAPETIAEHLARVLSQESVEAEPSALSLLARAARGSMRDALSLTDQAIAFGHGQLQAQAVRQMLGSVHGDHVEQILRALLQGQGALVVQAVEGLRMQGVAAAAVLEDMLLVLQRMAVLQVTTPPPEPGQLDPEASAHLALAQLQTPAAVQLLYSICLHGRSELGLAPDEYVGLTMVLLRFLAFAPQPSAEKKSPEPRLTTLTEAPAPVQAAAPRPSTPQVDPPLAAPPMAALQPADADAGLSSATATAPEAPPPLPEAPAPVLQALPVREWSAEGGGRADPSRPARTAWAPTALGQAWAQLVEQMIAQETVTALVRELALQAQWLDRDEQTTPPTWTLQVERASLDQGNTRQRLQMALAQLGHEVQLQVQMGPVVDSPAKRMAHAAAQKMQKAQELLTQDPMVQHWIEQWGGQIVPGSIQVE